MWKIAGASVPGTVHLAAGRPCDDACGWFAVDGLTCLLVADGAGSRPLSRQGSALAVHSALAAVRAGGPSGPSGEGADHAAWMRAILADVHASLSEFAAAQGRDPGVYATTLAVVVLTDEVACVGQIGDGIVVAHLAGAYETVAPAPRGEYVNETAFLTDDQGVADARITVLPAGELDAVFLATDGLRFKILGDLMAAAPFLPFFDDLGAYLRSPDASAEAIEKFLAGLTDDQSGDDKTLVGAVRCPGATFAAASTAGSAAVQ
jgi:Protein phosphatase 2C